MDNWLENQVTCTESLCWFALILVNQPLADAGLMKDEQRFSLHHVGRLEPAKSVPGLLTTSRLPFILI